MTEFCEHTKVRVEGEVIADIEWEQGIVIWYEPKSRTAEWQWAVQEVLNKTCGDTTLEKWGQKYMLNYEGAGYTLPFTTGPEGALSF